MTRLFSPPGRMVHHALPEPLR